MPRNRILLPNLSKHMHAPAQILKTLKARYREQKTQDADLCCSIGALCTDDADIGLRGNANHYYSGRSPQRTLTTISTPTACSQKPIARLR